MSYLTIIFLMPSVPKHLASLISTVHGKKIVVIWKFSNLIMVLSSYYLSCVQPLDILTLPMWEYCHIWRQRIRRWLWCDCFQRNRYMNNCIVTALEATCSSRQLIIVPVPVAGGRVSGGCLGPCRRGCWLASWHGGRSVAQECKVALDLCVSGVTRGGISPFGKPRSNGGIPSIPATQISLQLSLERFPKESLIFFSSLFFSPVRFTSQSIFSAL
jgi:hypothetical protein